MSVELDKYKYMKIVTSVLYIASLFNPLMHARRLLRITATSFNMATLNTMQLSWCSLEVPQSNQVWTTASGKGHHPAIAWCQYGPRCLQRYKRAELFVPTKYFCSYAQYIFTAVLNTCFTTAVGIILTQSAYLTSNSLVKDLEMLIIINLIIHI